MKSFTDIFIRRPVLAIVVNLVILVGGVQALRSLNARQYPRLESATVTIMTPYVGANADLVRGFITSPIERAVAAADGIDYIESQSTQGLSTINVRLKLNFDAAEALADISTRVDQVRGDLPPEAEVPAITVEPSDSQIASMYMSFDSPILDENQVTDYLVRVVQPRITAVAGVQRAEVLGGRAFAVRAWLDPAKMAAFNISPSQVRQALAAGNYLSAAGKTKGALEEVNLSATTDLTTLEDFKRLVVREGEGSLVRLEDIATVALGADNYDQEVRFSGREAVFMGVWVLPNANSIDVIRDVRREIAAIKEQLPKGINAHVAYDSTTYINNAIDEVVETLLETIIIVICVIFLFLGSLRSALIPVVAIPLSLIGAVFLMQVMGFSLNLLTLLAIVLAVGLVVDDAIVVVENVERNIGEGKNRFQAAIEGARELVGPVIAMTITLAAVYAPIGLQAGLTGALFREFAFTLAGAVLISGIVALTLSPMMASRLLKEGRREGWLAGKIARGFTRVRAKYERALDRSLARRGVTYAVWIVFSILIVPLYILSPKELAPNEDQGIVFGAIDVPPNATLERLMPNVDLITDIFKSTPEFAHAFQITFPNQGFGGMLVKPWEERDRSIFPIQNELFEKLSVVPGVRAPAFLPAPLPSPGMFPVEFVVASTDDHEEILRYVDKLTKKAIESGLFAFPPIVDVRMDQKEASLRIDKDKLATMGVSMQQISADLSTAFSGNFVNRFNIDGRAYKVIPQVKRKARLSVTDVQNLHVSGPDGTVIPLSSVASFEETTSPRTLNRFQQLNSVKISGLTPQSLEQGLSFLEDNAKKILPKDYRIDYTGESRQLRQEAGKFLPAMGLALLLIFLVLSAQFNSFRDPLVVLAGSVPLAMFGALIFTFLKFAGPPGLAFPLTQGWTTTLNIYSQVGLVTLVGLIAKNGILVVEFANAEQERGQSKLEAVRAAASTRLRPILMTSVATVAGHFPLTLVSGPGAEARNSIGVVLVGGMAIGTLFTLFIVPSLYILIAKDHQSKRSDQIEEPAGESVQPSGQTEEVVV